MNLNTLFKSDHVVITLVLGDKTYYGKGETTYDALRNLEKPVKLMGKAIVTIRKGAQERHRLLNPMRLKRLFTNPTFQKIQAKQLEWGMN